MSGGHWDYLYRRLEERAEYAGDVWKLLGEIEHELDYGISCDTCYECAKIRVINALETFFDTGASSVENALRILDSTMSECQKCRDWDAQQQTPRPEPPREAFAIQFTYGGKLYRGTAYADDEQKEVSE